MTRYSARFDSDMEEWNVIASKSGQPVTRHGGRVFTTYNESAAKSYAGRLNRGVYDHGHDYS